MSDNDCDSGRAVSREGKTAVQEQVGERSEKREKQPSGHQSQCSKRAGSAPGVKLKFPCSPGEAHEEAGCPPAAHGHHTEWNSMCRYRGAHGAPVDKA